MWDLFSKRFLTFYSPVRALELRASPTHPQHFWFSKQDLGMWRYWGKKAGIYTLTMVQKYHKVFCQKTDSWIELTCEDYVSCCRETDGWVQSLCQCPDMNVLLGTLSVRRKGNSWEDKITMDFAERGYGGGRWQQLAQNRIKQEFCRRNNGET